MDFKVPSAVILFKNVKVFDGVSDKLHYVDLLVVGNPLENITAIGGSTKLFDAPDRKAGEIKPMHLIMKDGMVYKNTLP